MRIHILGICGTFMGSLAVLAKQQGHQVSGSDANVYPPMSTQLEEQGIVLSEGYTAEHLRPPPDLVVVGNTISRGNPAVEYVLDSGLDYCSGPELLARWVLKDRWVLAVAGTHGKTTTSSMLAWILEAAGLKPGYLIGGVAHNFSSSASLGEPPFFVVEADEYDSAFFDKRSKFIHYRPRTAILNNLEFDHGDIFDDLAAIQRQFQHFVRIIPGSGLILVPTIDANLQKVLDQGCWTPCQRFGITADTGSTRGNGGVSWGASLQNEQGSVFSVSKYGEDGKPLATADVHWKQTGIHNVNNAVAAIAAAHHAGVNVDTAAEALTRFEGVKRRMELRGEVNRIRVYDDFAHHPTAIATTLQGAAATLKTQGKGRLIAVIEPRSNTMKMGTHQQALPASVESADFTVWQTPEGGGLDLEQIVRDSRSPGGVFAGVDEIVRFLTEYCVAGDHIVVMSNGDFGGIHRKLLDSLAALPTTGAHG
ncbi:MAG: UDP-N-acetylmuramate:L-alanyl-gamma-D-glutamyl-meso-diaminopimelate ligase [Pseudohongiellaceae bacterium]